jgi:hypothetical protein
MNRKALALTLTLAVLTAFGASAYTTAIGGEFSLKIGDGLPSSTLLSFHIPKLPPVFGLGVSLQGEGGQSSFVLLADWWLAQGNLVNFVNYYVGPGAFLSLSDSALLGLRIPVGFTAFPIKPLELFAEFAPAVYLLAPSGTITIPSFGLQAGFGFRFWF